MTKALYKIPATDIVRGRPSYKSRPPMKIVPSRIISALINMMTALKGRRRRRAIERGGGTPALVQTAELADLF